VFYGLLRLVLIQTAAINRLIENPNQRHEPKTASRL
jgi:hypothetical protein